MRDSKTLMILEYSLWVGCISFIGWATYRVIKKFIYEDFHQYKSTSIIYRYSSIIGIITSALFSIIIFRLSNRFLDEGVNWTQLGLVNYIITLSICLAMGYFWMNLILKKYNMITKHYSHQRSDQYARNILVFLISTSFFCLILAVPSAIEQNLPIIREIYLTIFLGGCVKYLFGFENQPMFGDIRKKLIQFFKFFS